MLDRGRIIVTICDSLEWDFTMLHAHINKIIMISTPRSLL